MALIQCKIFSQALFRSVNVNVTLPTPDSNDSFFDAAHHYPEEGKKYQVLWLLHGFTADESDWQRFSSIERYAQLANVAVVMPDGYNSMYANDGFGAAYYDFYTQELPEVLPKILPLSTRREDNFIAGLSMGGFGAFKAALRNPEKYAAAASLSGGLLMERAADASPEGVGRYAMLWRQTMFGKDLERMNPHQDHLLVILKDQVEAGADLPALYQCCGTEDFLYESNQEFLRQARAMGVEITYEEGPGVHNFDFWDPFIRRILDWLPLSGGLV